MFPGARLRSEIARELLERGYSTLTLRQPLYYAQKGGNSLDQRFYKTGQFARKASVSIRTLRYYDKEGLLAPSQYSEFGLQALHG